MKTTLFVRLYYSYFPPRRQLLLQQLVQWLVQAEKCFRGTLDFAYALLLLCEEATLLRYSSDHFDINWFPADFLIIEQGEAANSLYLILSGTVDVIHEEADGTLQVLVCAGILVHLDDRLNLTFGTQSSFWVMTSVPG